MIPPAQNVKRSSAIQVAIVCKSVGPSRLLPDCAPIPLPGICPVGNTDGIGGILPSGRAMRKRKEPRATCPSVADWVCQTTTYVPEDSNGRSRSISSSLFSLTWLSFVSTWRLVVSTTNAFDVVGTSGSLNHIWTDGGGACSTASTAG